MKPLTVPKKVGEAQAQSAALGKSKLPVTAAQGNAEKSGAARQFRRRPHDHPKRQCTVWFKEGQTFAPAR